MEFRSIGNSGDSGTSKEDFLRLKDGDTHKVLFRGKLHETYALWNGQFYEEVPRGTKSADGERKAAFRFKINVVMEESPGKYVAKIFEQGFALYEQMAEVNKEYVLEKNWMKLSRKGSGPQDTTYAIVPAKGGEVTPEEDAKISKVKLHALKKEEPKETNQESPPYGDEDVPFDE